MLTTSRTNKRSTFRRGFKALRSILCLATQFALAFLLGFAWIVALQAHVEFAPLLATGYAAVLVVMFLLVHARLGWPRSWIGGRLAFPAPVRRLLPSGVVISTVFALGTLALILSIGDLPAAETESATERLVLPWLVVFAVPVVEEFVFRGWMQTLLQRLAGPIVAIVVVAALFAGLHGEDLFVANFAGACFYGAAVWASGSLWVAIALHAAANGLISVLDTSPAVDRWGRSIAADGPWWLDAATVGLLTVGVLGGAWWVWRVRRALQSATRHGTQDAGA